MVWMFFVSKGYCMVSYLLMTCDCKCIQIDCELIGLGIVEIECYFITFFFSMYLALGLGYTVRCLAIYIGKIV